MKTDAPDIFLAGPTAVGKSAVALYLAQRLNGEIVSVDSMQVYRELDIGTAKPSAKERKTVRHHLVDVIGISESFDTGRFIELAQVARADILSRRKRPIFCGGTGLYFKALLEGLGDAPKGDPVLRAELEKMPLPELMQELSERDPITFNRIDRNNPRRVIRAIEVVRLTGQSFGDQRAPWRTAARNSKSGDAPAPPSHFFGLQRSPNELRRRIDDRVDRMFADGLVEETRRLVDRGLAANRTALQALGYRQVAEYLRGQRALAETITLVKVRTRQFAKRQMTWFRNQFELDWLFVDERETPEAIGERLLSNMKCRDVRT